MNSALKHRHRNDLIPVAFQKYDNCNAIEHCFYLIPHNHTARVLVLDMTVAMPHNDLVSNAVQTGVHRLTRVVLFSGLVNMLTLSGSFYMLQVYDRVIPSRDAGTLAGLSAIVLLAYLLQGYLDALRTRMLSRIAAQFDSELQMPIYSLLADLPLSGAKPGELQQPLRDLDQVRAFIAGAGPVAFLDMPWIPVFLIILFLFHPLLGFVAIAGATSIIAVTLLAERRSSGYSRRSAVLAARRQVLADATRTHADVIRALGMLSRFKTQWIQLNDKVLTETVMAMAVHANLGALGKLLRYSLQSAMLGLGAYLVVNEQATGGIMIASSIVMGRALAPIEIALGSWRQLAAARNGLRGLRKSFAGYRGPRATRSSYGRPSRHLTVRAVSICAPDRSEAIVRDVTFQLEAGSGLAIIGTSGSGKSSLLRGIAGVWPLGSGDIRLDGIDLTNFDVDERGRYLGYLPQEVGLFDGTIFDNIARFDPDAEMQAVVEAAAIAGAHEMISQFPDGYSTEIGQGGVALSAGQRQRVGLARAIFGNPFLIVLDEPNANLDAEGEAALCLAIRELRKRGSVVIVVSHRVSALEALDSILVLSGGRMAAFGSRTQIEAALAANRNQRAAATT